MCGLLNPWHLRPIEASAEPVARFDENGNYDYSGHRQAACVEALLTILYTAVVACMHAVSLTID